MADRNASATVVPYKLYDILPSGGYYISDGSPLPHSAFPQRGTAYPTALLSQFEVQGLVQDESSHM
jgi:hypothetical protein